MSNRINNGGPAFPVECYWQGDAAIQGAQTGNSQGFAMGLTIRDYFAAKAMQGAFSSPIPSSQEEKGYIARHAYLMADAMLAVRGEQK